MKISEKQNERKRDKKERKGVTMREERETNSEIELQRVIHAHPTFKSSKRSHQSDRHVRSFKSHQDHHCSIIPHIPPTKRKKNHSFCPYDSRVFRSNLEKLSPPSSLECVEISNPEIPLLETTRHTSTCHQKWLHVGWALFPMRQRNHGSV